MTNLRLAYMPLITYPDLAPDESVIAAADLAVAMEWGLHSTVFAVSIPHLSSTISGLLINIPELIRTTEENSQAECNRLRELVQGRVGTRIEAFASVRRTMLGLTGEAAAAEARYFDLSVLPWAKERIVLQELAQAVVFGSGRPAILVPPVASPEPIRNVAIAWDGSRVAARALSDALSLLTRDARITILTVRNEKPLDRPDVAEALVRSLERRGLPAQARNVNLDGRTISEALQREALYVGAGLLVMGGFGHSRVRDFVLGGATKGVMADLHLPVLLSH